jgi:hypothetical protein
LALAVAGAIFFLPTRGSYVEYAVVDVAPAARPAPVESKATPLLPLVAPSAQVARSVESTKTTAISLGGVTEAITSAAKPTAPNQSPSQANATSQANTTSTPNAASTGNASSAYRPAFLASIAEREEAADIAGVPREDFVKACDRDHDLHIAASGQSPFYMCYGLKSPIGPDVTAITTTPSYPTTQTFILHSRPTATRKIYLDFTGHTTTGTQWNNPPPSGLGKTTFTTPPFSLDANTAAFSNAEHAAIQYVWRSIAEDFAQFDVDVTTEDPGAEGLKRASTEDLNYGMRVVFGPDQNATGSGGQGYIGSFNGIRTSAQTDVPCFVYASTSAGSKFMAEAGAHEVGHTVGLYHDGVSAVGTTAKVEYFPGHGTGATSWAPIMGNSYSKVVTHWSKGEYTNANNTQDDFTVMSSYIPLTADDHGGTMATARVVTGTTITGGGLINNANDIDMFKITAGSGMLVITPKGVLISPNLRLQVKVLKSDGTVLNTYDAVGTAGMMAPNPITYNVTEEGTYYIQLDGIASGTGVTDGYSDYASGGIYGLTASWIVPGITPPITSGNKPPIADASFSTGLSYNYQTEPGAAVNFNATQSYDPDGLIVSYLWNFADVYPQTAGGPIATHRYRTPGVYRPVLTVTDDRGAISSTLLTVNVAGPVKPKTHSLALISASFIRVNSVSDAVNASVAVQDQYGYPLKGAIVFVRVSGIVSAPAVMARTDSLGNITVRSPVFKRGARGTVRIDVDGVTSKTHSYEPSDNIPPTFVTVTR